MEEEGDHHDAKRGRRGRRRRSRSSRPRLGFGSAFASLLFCLLGALRIEMVWGRCISWAGLGRSTFAGLFTVEECNFLFWLF
jgi:hypothetical protein